MLQNKVKEKVWEEMDTWLEFVTKGNKKYKGIGTGGNINRYFKMSNNEYLEPLKTSLLNNYYEELLNRLQQKYPASLYTKQYNFQLKQLVLL